MSMAENPLYLAHHYFKGLQSILGQNNVIGYYHNDDFNKAYYKGIVSKIRHRLVPKLLYSKISNHLLELVDKHEPDVILIFKGQEILPDTLSKIKTQNIKLVNYNLDHPFEFHSRGSGNKNVLESIQYFDLHISYSQRIVKQMQEKFTNVKTAWLPFGYAIDDNLFEKIKFKDNETNALCFIGVADKQRIAFIKKIAKTNFPIHLYGHGWDKAFSEQSNLKIFDGVYNDEYWKTLHNYRIQLNLFRSHNKESHNMRSFEVPAVAGIMLAPRTKEHLSFFQEGKEAFYFDSEKEAIEKINYLLSLSTLEANEIRRNARKKSNSAGYSYTNRAKDLHNIIKGINN